MLTAEELDWLAEEQAVTRMEFRSLEVLVQRRFIRFERAILSGGEDA